MRFRSILAGSDTERELGVEDLKTPFLLGPSRPHPRLTLGDYFDAVQRFLLTGGGGRVWRFLGEGCEPSLLRGDVDEFRIRSEKHGAFYHVARVDCVFQGGVRSFAVLVALSDVGKHLLKGDFHHMELLSRTFGGGYLPQVCFMDEIASADTSGAETWVMALAEWLDGFHEWHYARGSGTDPLEHICIWDTQRGGRYAEADESSAIYRGVARILTHYYDTEAFRQVYPWHHAAGDFVVSAAGDGLRVRLTTVRGYAPMPFFEGPEPVEPFLPLLYFFLGLALKTRLDKLDGTGRAVWAPEWVLRPTLEGFLEALRAKAGAGLLAPGKVKAFFELLRSFSAADLMEIYESLLPLWENEDPEDFALILAELRQHAAELFKTIQSTFE